MQTTRTTYAVRFDFPEGECFAGIYKGAAGFAPTLATAQIFFTDEQAFDALDNGYGPSARKWARVVKVEAGTSA